MIEPIMSVGQAKHDEKPHQKHDSKHRRISDFLNDLEAMSKDRPLTLEILLTELGPQRYGFLILLLSFPFLLPIPIPGLSVLFGLIITAVTIAWIFSSEPWIPEKFKSAHLPQTLIQKAPILGRKIFARVEFLIRPRFIFMLDWWIFRVIIATAIITAALFLALPLPPGTNFPPALIIFALAFSIIERDGLLALLAIGGFVAEIYLFSEVITYLFHWVHSYFV
ncbi:MAG: exopolysaccharide biosynthesis protein [Bdellovibrionales bacterium]|nr:exopolysaccharide biosynthesis protein [Bdellovibrionales bacterium]